MYEPNNIRALLNKRRKEIEENTVIEEPILKEEEKNEENAVVDELTYEEK
jgi:hypothetical protein